MATKILVAYSTNAGSTGEVAQALGKVLAETGAQVEVHSIREVETLGGYGAIVLAGPMIFGWHRKMLRFIAKNRKALAGVPIAYCMTGLHVTRAGEPTGPAVPLTIDPEILEEPGTPDSLTFRERHTSIGSYLGPVLKRTSPLRPISIGIFAGKLDYRRLKLPQKLFVMLVIAAKAGDSRDWEAIGSWARETGRLIDEATQGAQV